MMRRLIIFSVIFWGVSLTAYAETPLKVFVSILPLKHFVERIGGEHVGVSVMVAPGQSPATYSPTPRQILALSEAKLYFAVGALPFETAWQKRIQAANPAMQWVRTDQGVTLKTREDAHDGHDGHDGHDKHGDHDEHEHGQSDPHVWLSPLLARQMSQTVLSNLQTVMPQQAELFARNHAAWDADLLKLHTDIQAMFTDLARKQFMIFHPSWGYFADAYDLQQISIEAYGKEPGPRSLARLIDFARAEKIAAIFVQKQFSRRAAQSIAEAVGAVLIEVDPLAENYLDNMRKAARLFAGQ